VAAARNDFLDAGFPPTEDAGWRERGCEGGDRVGWGGDAGYVNGDEGGKEVGVLGGREEDGFIHILWLLERDWGKLD